MSSDRWEVHALVLLNGTRMSHQTMLLSPLLTLGKLTLPEVPKVYPMVHVCVCAQSLSHAWLCDPMDCSPLGSSVHGIFQARILEWVTICSSRRSSGLRDRTCICCIEGPILYLWATREAIFHEDGHLTGSPIQDLLQWPYPEWRASSPSSGPKFASLLITYLQLKRGLWALQQMTGL